MTAGFPNFLCLFPTQDQPRKLSMLYKAIAYDAMLLVSLTPASPCRPLPIKAYLKPSLSFFHYKAFPLPYLFLSLFQTRDGSWRTCYRKLKIASICSPLAVLMHFYSFLHVFLQTQREKALETKLRPDQFGRWGLLQSSICWFDPAYWLRVQIPGLGLIGIGFKTVCLQDQLRTFREHGTSKFIHFHNKVLSKNRVLNLPQALPNTAYWLSCQFW